MIEKAYTTETKNKKKIIIFLPKFPVLTETFIERDIAKLIELDNLDVTVLYIEKGNGVTSSVVEKHAVEVRLTLMSSIIAARYFFTKPKKVLEAFKVLGFKNIYLFLKSVGYAQVFSKYQPDEIHAHFLSDPSTISMVASILLDIPFSINAHARDVTEYPSFAKEKIKRAKFISICNTNAYKVCKNFVNYADNIYMIRHGIDKDKIFDYPITIKKSKKPMIYLGGTRLEEKKGIKYLIKAAKELDNRGYDFEVHITGPGSLYEKLLRQINALELENIVFIHGNGKGVPFEIVSQYYRIADILVLPSIELESGDADGIPNALIEASLAKLPIITTDAGSITELIKNDINGVVVPQRDYLAIAEAVVELLGDEGFRKRLGEVAFIKAVDMFDIDTNVRSLEKLLLK